MKEGRNDFEIFAFAETVRYFFSSFFRETFQFWKNIQIWESGRINQDTRDIFISRSNLTSASSLIFPSFFFPSSHTDTRADKCHNVEISFFSPPFSRKTRRSSIIKRIHFLSALFARKKSLKSLSRETCE